MDFVSVIKLLWVYYYCNWLVMKICKYLQWDIWIWIVY